MKKLFQGIIITAQKIKISITNFFSKCDQICSFLPIWLHLLKKSVMENFSFCAVYDIDLLNIFYENRTKNYDIKSPEKVQ